MKRMIFCLMAMMGVLTLSAQSSIYDFTVKDDAGEDVSLDGLEILDFPCNQFGEQAPGSIQEIHQFCTANFNIHFPQFDKIDVNGANEHPLYTFLKAQKGFGGFDTNDQRGKFMDEMMRKQDADYDKKSDIKWNFTKFLVSRDGRVLKRYEPTDKLSDIEADLQMEVCSGK